MNLKLIGGLALLLAAAPTLADDKWEVSTTMEMTGMPFQLPGRTQQVCVPPGQQSGDKLIPQDKSCTISNLKVTGNRTSFHMDCKGKQPVSGDMEVTQQGRDAYSGKMTAKTVVDGTPTEMRMTYSGRKIGVCGDGDMTVGRIKTQMAQQQAMAAGMCRKEAEAMNLAAVDGEYAPCKDQKPVLCKAVKATLAKASDPTVLFQVKQDHGDWQQLGQACGIDVTSLQQSACEGAKSRKLWPAVAEFCGDEAAALAEANCTGRSYSVIMTGEYGPLCQRFSDKVKVQGQSRGGIGGLLDKGGQAMDGVNKLRGLFGR